MFTFTTKQNNKGFTLVELLVAISLSAIVLTGVYALFDSVLSTKESTSRSNDKTSLLLSARKIIKPDMLQIYKDTLKISDYGDNDELEFKTANSIKLEKAMPVNVRYYVEDGWLIRNESIPQIDYEWELYLLKNVEEFDILSHNGYDFGEESDPSDTIIKIRFKVSETEIEFVAGAGHVNLSGDYEGKKWR